MRKSATIQTILLRMLTSDIALTMYRYYHGNKLCEKRINYAKYTRDKISRNRPNLVRTDAEVIAPQCYRIRASSCLYTYLQGIYMRKAQNPEIKKSRINLIRQDSKSHKVPYTIIVLMANQVIVIIMGIYLQISIAFQIIPMIHTNTILFQCNSIRNASQIRLKCSSTSTCQQAKAS